MPFVYPNPQTDAGRTYASKAFRWAISQRSRSGEPYVAYKFVIDENCTVLYPPYEVSFIIGNARRDYTIGPATGNFVRVYLLCHFKEAFNIKRVKALTHREFQKEIESKPQSPAQGSIMEIWDWEQWVDICGIRAWNLITGWISKVSDQALPCPPVDYRYYQAVQQVHDAYQIPNFHVVMGEYWKFTWAEQDNVGMER